MSVEVAQVVIDCSDAEKLAGFWSQLLQRPVEPGANTYYAMLPGSPAIMLLAVPEAKQVKNRVHLDLRLGEGAEDPDWQGELERILALGATQVSEHREHGVHWVCLKDPEGNEFDLAVGH